MGTHQVVGLASSFALLLLSIATNAVIGGCSGATASEVLEPSGTGTATADPNDPTSKATSGASSTSTPKGNPGPETTDPGAGQAPAPTCAVEVEGNDLASEATTFTSCITGTITDWTDTDFLRIVAPAKAKTMIVRHKETKGKIFYRVRGEHGLPLGLETTFIDEAPPIDVKAGEAVLFQLGALNNLASEERPYEINVTFE